MVGLRAKVLGRLGRTENSPSKSVCSILPLARHLRAGKVECVNPGPRLAAKASGAPIGTAPKTNRYSTQTMARAPTTASAASTQKSIASIHSPLSLAVGYNRVVTHGRRRCNNVVATLAKDKTPSLQRSSRCRAPASILPLAALLFSASCGAASALRPLRVARDLGWCDHDYPGGAGTTLGHACQ